MVAMLGPYLQPPLILLLLMLLLRSNPGQVLLEEEDGRGGYRPVQVSQGAAGPYLAPLLSSLPQRSAAHAGHTWAFPSLQLRSKHNLLCLPALQHAPDHQVWGDVARLLSRKRDTIQPLKALGLLPGEVRAVVGFRWGVQAIVGCKDKFKTSRSQCCTLFLKPTAVALLPPCRSPCPPHCPSWKARCGAPASGGAPLLSRATCAALSTLGCWASWQMSGSGERVLLNLLAADENWLAMRLPAS